MVDKLFDEAVELLKQKGAEVIDNISFENRRKWGGPSYQVLLYEFKADLNKYLSEHPSSPMKTLKQSSRSMHPIRTVEMPWFGQEIFKLAQEKGDLTTREYLDALSDSKKVRPNGGNRCRNGSARVGCGHRRNKWSGMEYRLGKRDNFSGSSSSPAAISGYPNISVPDGLCTWITGGHFIFWKGMERTCSAQTGLCI
jgi:amidase